MIDRKTFYQTMSEITLVKASTMPIKELIEKLESLAYIMHSPVLQEAANRLRNASCAATILEDSLFYARGSLSKTFWPTLPDASETFVAEVFAVVAEIGLGDECRGCAVGYLRVDVVRSHDSVYVAHEDCADLQCA